MIAADGTATAGAAADAGTPSGAEQRIDELSRQLETSDAKANRLEGDLAAALADAAALRRAAETAEAELAEIARLRDRPPAEREAGQDLAQIKEPATAEAEAVSTLKASLAGGEAQSAARSAELDPARARAELRAANQRIAELEAAIRLGLAKLAPRPAPPAPR